MTIEEAVVGGGRLKEVGCLDGSPRVVRPELVICLRSGLDELMERLFPAIDRLGLTEKRDGISRKHREAGEEGERPT